MKDIFIGADSWAGIFDRLLREASFLALKIIGCIIIYIVGRKVIHYLNRFIGKMMNSRKLDSSVVSFFKSLINILLTVALLFLIVNVLGINNSSFIALLASIGVALGMALSGTLQNFSGGVVILLFRPYKVGDYISAQGQEGTVTDIQIFNTVIVTFDNRTIFIPNGGLSSNVIVNYSKQKIRRVDWVFGVAYGSDYDKVKRIISDVLHSDNRILTQPAPSIFLKKLGDNSVNIAVQAWVLTPNYYSVCFYINEAIYKHFAASDIEIPFPQLTVHQAKNR